MKSAKPCKVLIISHVSYDSLYGAGTSMRGHFAAFEDDEGFAFSFLHAIDFRKPSHFLNFLFSSAAARCAYFLPHSYNYDSIQLTSLPRKALEWVRFQSARMNRWLFLSKMRQIAPDVIHLNSVVLIEIVDWIRNDPKLARIPIVLHVREMLTDPASEKQVASFAKVDRLICIDQSTRSQMLKVTKGRVVESRAVVVQNPFSAPDATQMRPFTTQDLGNRYAFAIVGKVSEDKGVLLVCQAFLEAETSNAVLLVAGEARGVYGQSVKDLAQASQGKIMVLGEIEKLSETDFYTRVDCVVRGDSSFRVGRTVYEAVFAGGKALIPGSTEDVKKDEDLAEFKEAISTYRPNDRTDLSRIMADLVRSRTDRSGKLPRSNHSKYHEKLVAIYRSVFSSSERM